MISVVLYIFHIFGKLYVKLTYNGTYIVVIAITHNRKLYGTSMKQRSLYHSGRRRS